LICARISGTERASPNLAGAQQNTKAKVVNTAIVAHYREILRAVVLDGLQLFSLSKAHGFHAP
jgi:hypothetical protein